jgi:hypothetical protein
MFATMQQKKGILPFFNKHEKKVIHGVRERVRWPQVVDTFDCFNGRTTTSVRGINGHATMVPKFTGFNLFNMRWRMVVHWIRKKMWSYLPGWENVLAPRKSGDRSLIPTTCQIPGWRERNLERSL